MSLQKDGHSLMGYGCCPSWARFTKLQHILLKSGKFCILTHVVPRIWGEGCGLSRLMIWALTFPYPAVLAGCWGKRGTESLTLRLYTRPDGVAMEGLRLLCPLLRPQGRDRPACGALPVAAVCGLKGVEERSLPQLMEGNLDSLL